MKSRLRALVFLPLVAAALTWTGRYAWDRWTAFPILDYPRTLDLGERERGEIALGRFTIANRGRGKLQLNQFFTTCSCTRVEREFEGQFQSVESVSVPPGEQIELVVRLGVGVPPGERQVEQVIFSSNDPSQPGGKIDVMVPHVKGGVYTLPTAVLFGDVRVGNAAQQVIDLYDNRQAGRRIDKVRSLQPERFQVRLLPLDDQELVPVHDRGGRLITRLEVIALTTKPGPLRGWIEVSLTNEARPPDIVSVFGEVVQDVECRPSTLLLPRRAGERVVFSGQMHLRHRDGLAMQVKVESSPTEMSAKVRPLSEGEFPWLLEVEWMRPQPAHCGEKTIRLIIRSGDNESLLKVPVLLTTVPNSESASERAGGDS